MSIRKRDVHFSDWTKVRHALVCNNVQGITETSSFDEVRAFLINSESGSNPFYYYVCYIKETNEIYTHGAFYNCTGYNDSDIRDLIQSVEDSFVEQITALQNEVEENEKVTTMALYDLNDRKANKDDLQNINLDKYVDWDSLYSETNSLYSSLQSSINSNYTTLNNNKADKTDLEALSAEVEENEEVTAAALTELHENKADKSEIPDVSTLATKADLAPLEACCDTKLSCEDLGTINGQSICGNDVTITEPDHYASGTATVDGSGFVTSVTTNEAGHVTKVSARAITDNDITSISASKITGTINIDNIPQGALERMFVVEDETAAMSATVEEGDVVQVTGNGNKMYFCVRSGATIFSEKFMEFTAGTATSVAWSGVTGKPEGIDGWGDRISTVEADYFSSTGGTITGDVANPLTINRTTMDSVGLLLRANNIIKGEFGWASASGTYIYNAPSGGLLGIKDDGTPHFQGNTLLHFGNYNTYSPSLTGAGASGSWGIDITGSASSANKLNSYYSSRPTSADVAITGDGSLLHFKATGTMTTSKPSGDGHIVHFNWDGGNGYDAQLFVPGGGNAVEAMQYRTQKAKTWGYWKALLDSSNYSDYALPKDGTAVAATTLKTNSGYVYARTFDVDKIVDIGADATFQGYSTYIDGMDIRFRYGSANATAMQITTSGNVAIGGTTADELLHVHGIAKASLYKSVNGYTLASSAETYCGLVPNSAITSSGNSSDFWLYNTTDIKYQAANHYFVGGNVAIGGTTADEKLHVHGKMVVSGNIKIPGSNDGRYSLYSDGGIRFYAPSSGGWSNTWNLFSNDGGTANGTLCGAFGEGSSLKYIFFGGTWDSPKTVQWPDGTFSIGRGTTKDAGRLNVGGNIRIIGETNPLIALIRGSDSARYVQAVSTGLRVGVGGTTNLLIQDDGKCKAVDFITTSDNRLKDFVSDIDLDFEALKLIPKKYYYWKDKSMGEELQIGTSAQELAKIYPTCVSYDEVSDRYSVNYQKLSIVALAAIDKLHERVSELESKLND